jgi:hypothetical protein
MDMLTFTLMVAQAAIKTRELTSVRFVRDWRFKTWPAANGIWVDCTPTWPLCGFKFNFNGTPFDHEEAIV